MKINVYCSTESYNEELVFSGDAQKFIDDNQGDDDVIAMVEDAEKYGETTQSFISGLWRVEKIEV